MNKNVVLTGVVLVFFLSGCASVRVGPEQQFQLLGRTITVTGTEGFLPSSVTQPNPHQPNVFMVNDKIVLDQEPVRPVVEQDGVYQVTWALAYGGKYSFPSDTAITFASGAPSLQCVRGPRNKSINCAITKPTTLPAHWKYTITVQHDSGATQTLDPAMYMD